MPGEGRRGRRDNGLDAVAFVPLLDVDPRVGEHLLDVLGSAGVPAFLEPSADVEPYTRALSLPSPPTDRLWVDRDQRRQARQIVDAETPQGPRPIPPPRDDEPSHGLADAEEERVWQAIVAGFDAPTAERAVPQDPPAPGPDLPPGSGLPPRPDLPPGSAPPSPAADWNRPLPYRERDDLIADPWSDAESERSRRRRTRGGPADTDPLPTGKDLDRAAEARADQDADTERSRQDPEDLWIDGPPSLDDGTEEHFEPPPPPPVPRPSRNTVLAILLLVLGILFMAVPQVLGLDDRSGLTLGVLAVLASAVLLVLRLREARDEDGPDDGAIV
jgi:hypothetical protein